MKKTHEFLGTTTNLLYGYKAGWLSEETGNNALFPLPEKALKESKNAVSTEKGKWSFPHISLHETSESLIDTLLPYKVSNPSDGFPEATLPSGALMLSNSDRKTAIKKLSKTLGVDLSAKENHFALVQLKRIDGQTAHDSCEMDVLIHPNPARIPEELGVTENFQRSVAELKRVKPRGAAFNPSEVSQQDAQGYLDLFSQQGTHYISKITEGDVVFQVYAMPKERFDRVRKIYTNKKDELSGPDAVLFRQFTTNAKTGAYGYVNEYGNILSFSQSGELTDTLKKGLWKEQTFAETNSIFAVFQNNSPINLQVLNQSFTDSTAVLTELTSLTLFLEHSRKQIWKRVFKAAAVQIFRSAVRPYFRNYCGYDLEDKLQQNEIPGFLSTIATPYINTYKAGLDLSKLEFVGADEVKSFTLYGNYLYDGTGKPISLPGTDILVSGQVFSLETDTYTTTVQVKDEALASFAIYSQHFFGGLQIQNTSNNQHYTLVDGLRYQTTTKGPDKRFYVKIDEDVRRPPKAGDLDRLKQSLQFNYAFSESNLNAISQNPGTSLFDFLRESLIWITQIIPAGTKDMDLLDLRLRALDLAYIGKDTNLGIFVSILPFEQYQSQIDTILDYIGEIDRTIDRYHTDIEIRKTQELVIDVAKDLNKNIIDSGKLLAGYVDASLEQQKALSGYYDSIIKQKQQEQKVQQKTINDLQAQLNTQQAEVDTAVRNYEQSLKDYQVTEAIKFGITITTDLFSLGTSIAIPASSISAVKDLGLMVQRIQKFLNIVNATYKVYSDAKSSITNLNNAQKTFDNISDALSANLGWDELSIKLDEVFATGPSDRDVTAKKAALVTAFKILVLKGKALTNAESKIQQTAREIYDQQKQKNLVDDQVRRMKELNTNLEPSKIKDLDKSKIDLMGLTGSLSLIRSQMLGVLAKAFIFKDQALQYTYLQEPTTIKSFDTIGIKGALVTQVDNTTTAKTEWSQFQSATTTPIEVEVEVPTHELHNGGIYQFNIQPSIPQFFKYVDTRVMSVVAKIDGIETTDSEKYLLELAYNGRPFFDRSYDRDTVVFNTLRRQRTYEYKVKGNKPLFSDKGESWSDGVNPVTPFSIWEISLPESKTNKGLKLKGLTTKVTLTFILKARIHDAKARLMRAFAEEKLYRKPANLMAEAAPAKPAINTLLSEMSGKSVLNNWDVVFNMSLSKINNVLESQYNDLKKNTSYGGNITTNTSVEGADIGDIKTYTLQKFAIQYGYPQLTFLVNNDNSGKLNMIISSGTVQKGSKYIGKNTTGDRNLLEAMAVSANLPKSAVKEEIIDGKTMLVLQYYNDPQPLGTTATLEAVIKISKVKGLVNGNDNILSVVLDMSQGTFTPNNIQIDMNDEQKLAFSEAVKAYFTQNPVKFIINSLDLSGIATLADLKPHQFLFKPFKSHGGNEMLMLFIQTNNRDVFNYSQTFISTDVPDPIPEGSECSLIINSRIFFGSVLPKSMATGWTLQGVNPNDTNKAWSAKFANASVEGSVDLSSLDHSYSPPRGMSVTYYSYRPSQNPTAWPLNGMTIKPSSNGQMNMGYDQKNTFYFIESSKTCSFWCSDPREQTLNTDITLQISAAMPTKITGSGREQGVKINTSNQSVGVSARTSGGGPCGSDDLQSKVNKQLKDHLPGQITGKINVNFNSVSVFALKNLLFPSNNYIDLSAVYVPGDLLIVGSFTTS
jgi:hypothetical protein